MSEPARRRAFVTGAAALVACLASLALFWPGIPLYDSIVHAPKALRFLIELAGLDNVVLGTDYSFPPADMEPLALLRSAGLSAADVEAIADANPRRVFTRLG